MKRLKLNARPYVENITASTTACLFAMVQGNLMLLTLSHWLTASQVGVGAGVVTSLGVALLGASRQWVVSTALAVITTIVDFLIHTGPLLEVVIEAVVTGLAAGVISFSLGVVLRRALAKSRAGADSASSST